MEIGYSTDELTLYFKYMTCIIGLKTSDKIYIAGDSAAIDDYTFSVVRNDEKVYIKKTSNYDLLLGFAGNYRYGQLLKYKWEVPKYDESEDFQEYLHTYFIDSIYELMNDNFLDGKNGQNSELGNAIIGFNNTMIMIHDDLHIEQINTNFSDCTAIGGGAEVAYGAMESLKNVSPIKRLNRSLEIVHKYLPAAVRPPFIIKSINIRK